MICTYGLQVWLKAFFAASFEKKQIGPDNFTVLGYSVAVLHPFS